MCDKLGGTRIPFNEYTELFGTLSDEAEFGDRVWEGMFKLLKTSKARQWIDHTLDDVIYGFFTAPSNFSKANALKEKAIQDSNTYPALFGPKQTGYDGRIVRPMLCLAILLNNGQVWWVDLSRVEFVGFVYARL